MDEAKNTDTENNEVNTVEVIKEEFEAKLQKMQAEYESRLSEMRTNHIEEIRTLMRSGQAPEDKEYHEKELSVEDNILQSLRNKYKLN